MKQFVMMLFGYTELRLSQSLATARFLHFKKINSQDFNKALRSLVPSKSLLMTKLLRSNLVAAHTCMVQCRNYQEPDRTQYGWIIGRSTEHFVADLANKEDELGTLMAAVTVTCSCSTKSTKNKCSTFMKMWQDERFMFRLL